MKTTRLLIALAAAFALPAAHLAAQSTVPGTISYQGRVTEADGSLVGNSSPTERTVIFRIWDNASATGAANLLYSERQTVTIFKGEFSVLVGNGDPVTGSPRGFDEAGKKLGSLADPTLWNGSIRFLGVTVCDEGQTTGTEVAPRQQIASTAYAIKAQTAEKIVPNGITADMIAPNAITASQLASGTITATQLAPNTITADRIANGTIDKSKFDLTSVYSLTDRNFIFTNLLPEEGGNPSHEGLFGYNANNDFWFIQGRHNGWNQGILAIGTGDDGTEPILFKQVTHSQEFTRMAINANGNVVIPGTLPDIRNDSKFIAESVALVGGNSAQHRARLYYHDWGKFEINLSQGLNGVTNRTASYDGDSNWDFESDARLKTDITPAEPVLDRILGLPFHRFRFKSDAPGSKQEFGVLAQEVQPAFPELVAPNGSPAPEGGNYLTVGLTSFGLYACKAIQELADRTDSDVETLNSDIATLQKTVAEKDAKIADLESRLAAIESALKNK